jgi:hypothetical protein
LATAFCAVDLKDLVTIACNAFEGLAKLVLAVVLVAGPRETGTLTRENARAGSAQALIGTFGTTVSGE